jgi:hypothetical protein
MLLEVDVMFLSRAGPFTRGDRDGSRSSALTADDHVAVTGVVDIGNTPSTVLLRSNLPFRRKDDNPCPSTGLCKGGN